MIDEPSRRSPHGIRLSTPVGIVAELTAGEADANATPYPRSLVTMVGEVAQVPADGVRVGRDGPGAFGHHRQLFAAAEGERLPVAITLVHVDGYDLAAVCPADVSIGIDLRRRSPSADDLREMRRHSHLFPGTSEADLLVHWTRVQAVRAADGRGARIPPEHVLIDPERQTGWAYDRRLHYRLRDLSTEEWTITLAHAGPIPASSHDA